MKRGGGEEGGVMKIKTVKVKPLSEEKCWCCGHYSMEPAPASANLPKGWLKCQQCGATACPTGVVARQPKPKRRGEEEEEDDKC